MSGSGTKQQGQLAPLTEEELALHQLPPHEIWYLMVNEVPCGPYSLDHLRDFLASNPDFDRQTLACHGQQEGWKPLNKYAFFPCPENPSEELPGTPEQFDQIMLMINGQPCGPYTRKQTLRQLTAKEILLTHLASVDQGKSWYKLYQHPAFGDYDHFSQEELPHMPEGQLFSPSPGDQQEGRKVSEKKSSSEESSERLSKLVSLVSTQEQLAESSPGEGEEALSPKGKALKITAAVVVVMAFYFYHQNLQELKSGPRPASVKLKKMAPPPPPARKITRSLRSNKRLRPSPSPSVMGDSSPTRKSRHAMNQVKLLSPPLQSKRPAGIEDRHPEDEEAANDFKKEVSGTTEEIVDEEEYGENEELETIEGEEWVPEEKF